MYLFLNDSITMTYKYNMELIFNINNSWALLRLLLLPILKSRAQTMVMYVYFDPPSTIRNVLPVRLQEVSLNIHGYSF